jgi:hypothetical protein
MARSRGGIEINYDRRGILSLDNKHPHHLIARLKNGCVQQPPTGWRCSYAAGPIRRTPSRLLRYLSWTALAWTLTLAVGVSCLQAQSEDGGEISREYAIKAAYLYKFGQYVEWPATAFADDQSPFVIGVLGTYPFGKIMEQIASTRRIEGRPVIVRRFATMAEYTPCHILFVVASAGPDQTAAAIEKAKRSSVLLVGEEAGFAEHGGTINFFVEENRVRFEVNTEAARQGQLKISSELLSLAKIVGRS